MRLSGIFTCRRSISNAKGPGSPRERAPSGNATECGKVAASVGANEEAGKCLTHRNQMHRPPSTSMAMPVRNSDARSARKSAAFAISDGLEKRPSGMPAANLAPVLRRVRQTHELLDHARFANNGIDGIDTDVLGSELSCHGFCERKGRTF